MRYDIAELTREEQALINEVISAEFGLYFPEGKAQILASRLEPRLRELRLKRFLDYYLKLQYSLHLEREHLVRLLTNNETYFFREKAQFEALFGPAIAELVAGCIIPGKLRILSSGCSSGEEPHTINIYARENRFQLPKVQVSVDAFDLDEERLAIARSAEYPQRSLRAMEADRIGRYFRTEDEKAFLLKEPYREGVRFRSGNIMDPAAFIGPGYYDVIFCRNVMIYFSEPAVRRAIDNFANALRPGGLLFLGHSESIIGMSPRLKTVRLGNCIAYRRVEATEA